MGRASDVCPDCGAIHWSGAGWLLGITAALFAAAFGAGAMLQSEIVFWAGIALGLVFLSFLWITLAAILGDRDKTARVRPADESPLDGTVLGLSAPFARPAVATEHELPVKRVDGCAPVTAPPSQTGRETGQRGGGMVPEPQKSRGLPANYLTDILLSAILDSAWTDGPVEEFRKGQDDFRDWGGAIVGSGEWVVGEIVARLRLLEVVSIDATPAERYSWQKSNLAGFCLRIQALRADGSMAAGYIAKLGEAGFGAFGFGLATGEKKESAPGLSCATCGRADAEITICMKCQRPFCGEHGRQFAGMFACPDCLRGARQDWRSDARSLGSTGL